MNTADFTALHRDLHRRRFLQVAGLTAMSLALANCGGSEETSGGGGASSDGDVLTSLKVGVDSDNFMTNMPLYVGREKGYFAEEGIEELEITITLDQFASALLSNSVSISHASTLSWFAAGTQSGEPIKWLGTLRDMEYLQLGVREGIESVDDLAGSKLTGGPAGSDNELNLKFILSELGVPESDVEIIPSDPGSDAWLAAVLSGNLDGALLFARHVKPLKDAGGMFLYQDKRAAPQDGFATLESFIQENQATVVAFMKGLIRTKQFYKDPSTRDEILQILVDNDLDVTEDLRASYGPELDQQSADGGFEVADMEAMVGRGIEVELIPEDLDWKEWVDLDPLWESQEANDLPRRPESI